MSPRSDKVAESIKKEICGIIRDELKDPRVGFVTITGVDLTADLRFAKIYYSVMGNEKVKNDTLEGLKKATGFIRCKLGERIRLKFTPEIRFMPDESLDYSQHIEEILKKINLNIKNQNLK